MTSHTDNVPEIAIRWIIRYSCTTNCYLASLSNVNKKWRSIMYSFFNDELEYYIRQLGCHGGEDTSGNRTRTPFEPYFSSLLLPEMALEMIRRCHILSNRGHILLGSQEYNQNRIDENNIGSFCLSWFAPSGIKVQPVNLHSFHDEDEDNHEDDDDELLISSSNGSKNENDDDEINFYRQRLLQQRRAQAAPAAVAAKKNNNDNNNGQSHINVISTTKEEDMQDCCYEWQGYRDATDILLPLGYSKTFVKSIFQMTSKLLSSSYFPSYDFLPDNNTNEHETTIAVRGAVFARPLLFCLCWDADRLDSAESKLTSQISVLNSSSNDGKSHQQNNGYYKRMDLQLRKRRHDRMRKCRMRQALPRVVRSAKVKNPILQDPDYGILSGKTQSCLQLLNADKSRAVYLRTPPFSCGPVTGPITMFCVGIATEDGCFVSGLETRFELGHLHGVDAMDKDIDMSPICVCAEEKKSKCQEHNGKVVKSYSEDVSDSSLDEDYQISRKGSIFCQCTIQYQKMNDDSSVEREECEEPDQKNIYRGQMGPGRWHCYTAIFNGKESVIRVDGCTERINNATSNSSSHTNHDTNHVSLDGLTIGSDHCFEMPLCFGTGSEGEGEGSIAELVCFKGSLPLQDIEYYEKFLMTKHGIVHGHQQIFPQKEDNVLVKNIGNRWQEDLWRRQVHALMTNPPCYDIGNVSIPLRVAANHRSVAWHRTNRVTGAQMKVSRIGAKKSNGSSDW